MALPACCTCATLLTSTTDIPSPIYDFTTEKPISIQPTSTQTPPRNLPCCSRAICAQCLATNPRFHTYCPFCQVSSGPSPLPQGLRDPPAYTSPSSSPPRQPDTLPPSTEAMLDAPPAYSTLQVVGDASSKQDGTAASGEPDVRHHLHSTDTLPALSLAYSTPLPILRTHNALFSDHLLSARKTLSIPRAYYSGPSLSADPIESEEESERKSAIRKFMVAAKCHEYEVAELYLKQADGAVEGALEAWREDERWERENPFHRGKAKREMRQKGRVRNGVSSNGLSGQLG